MTTVMGGEEEAFTFQWKIENASHWWWLIPGDWIESPTFMSDLLGDTRWTLRLYPMGYTDGGCIGFMLHRKKSCSGPDKLMVNVQFSFLGNNGSCISIGPISYSFLKGQDCGLPEFQERERVFATEREAFLPEDILTAQCTLWVTKEKPKMSNYLYATSVVKVERVGRKTMYSDEIFSDMEICTSTKSFPVHKNILSDGSPVFSSIFSNYMKVKNRGRVDIIDFDDDTVHKMLFFFYNDSLEDLQFESACNVYKIANKYQSLPLKVKCCLSFMKILSPTTACSILALADIHNDNTLKEYVQSYVLRLSNEIYSSQEWKDFMETHLKLAADIMQMKLSNQMPSHWSAFL